MSPKWVENPSIIPVLGPPAANGLAEDSPVGLFHRVFLLNTLLI